MSSNNSHIAKLAKAPLQEVIFEVFWELDIDPQTKESYDSGFELAQGVFAETAKIKFPFYRRVAPSIVPVRLLAFKPIHQFWTGEDQWPALQLGPGLLAANETERTYQWEESFRPTIEYALDTVLRSYKELPRFNKVSLRYIDAFAVEGDNRSDFIKFIETNLQVQVVRQFDVDGTVRRQSLLDRSGCKLRDGFGRCQGLLWL